MEKEVFSFYELVEQYDVRIPILQRDYAQGREENISICENFLKALKESILLNKTINLDFIYGNVDNGAFLPLDGQQRLTTLFLLHWYAFEKEHIDNNCRKILKKFSYETRLSSRRFCEALLDGIISIDASSPSISEQILDSKWFYLSWKQDPTIRAMLRTIDLIHTAFKEVDDLWSALVNHKYIVFHLLILENFGLSDDLYIKMNARGRLLTSFENLKAEMQDKASKEKWEAGKQEKEKFSYKIDGAWTDFLWQNYNKNHSVDNAHMNFITTLVMTKLPVGQLLKGAERIDVIQKLNTNSTRDLINYIDQETFDYVCEAYALYSQATECKAVPQVSLSLWRHAPERDFLNQILLGSNTSYSHKVLFYAQTRYLMLNPIVQQDKFEEWMRVVRNIVSRADLSPDGKRSDIIRSPETFNGAIYLISELAEGCSDIYSYLCSSPVYSIFAREQVKEEILKANIIRLYPEYKDLLFKIEDNELLRGKITFALECAGYHNSITEIDFELLAKIQIVFEKYFNKELEGGNLEFDKFRRAMLTVEVSGKYQYYNYWWSYWNAAGTEKRKLFPVFREIEYFIGLDEYKEYFKKLVLKLTETDYDTILTTFEKPNNMENWQYRLIKEEKLLAHCTSKYIAIAPDRTYCYLMRSKRPSDTTGSTKIE